MTVAEGLKDYRKKAPLVKASMGPQLDSCGRCKVEILLL